MNTAQTLQIITENSGQTEEFAANLARNLVGGEAIELISDLGGGKTAFVRGLAHGIGSKQIVTSPTFKLSNVYKGSELTLAHFDFYRLNEAGLTAHELEDFLNDPKYVIAVEWGQVVVDVLPEKRLKINIVQLSPNKREINLSIPEKLEYLSKDLA